MVINSHNTHTIDLWMAWQHDLEPQEDRLSAVLAPEEHQRAAKLHFAEHRNQYILRRGALRMILAGYLNQPAEDIQFTYNPFGKPEVANSSVSFNTSHSQALTMIAVTHGRKLGVDVEYQRSVRNMGGIVQRFSADIERLVWQVNPTVEQFYDLWTQKEAYVKAIGRGLSYPLHAFSMITTRGEGWQEHTIPNENKVPEQWSVYRFAPAPHYLGALVVEGHADALRMFSFTTV